MKKRKNLLIIGLVVIAILVLVTPAAAKKLVLVRYTDIQAVCEILDPGVEWMDGNMLYVRGRERIGSTIATDPWSVNPSGVNKTVVNYDLDLTTGIGYAWGSYNRLFDGDPDTRLVGTWTGDLTTFVDFVGRFKGVGTGIYDGTINSGKLVSVPISELPHGLCDRINPKLDPIEGLSVKGVLVQP